MIPEILASAALFILFAMTSHWFMMLCNLPVTAWLIHRQSSVPKGNIGVYDPTEMYSQQHLRSHIYRNLFKVAFYLLSFLVYLYSFIIAIIARH